MTLRNCLPPRATVRVRAGWPCLWQVLQKGLFLEVSNVALLRFAWQAWHFVTFRQTCFATCQNLILCGRHNTFATFSEDALHVSWQAQYFGDLHLHFAWQSQRLRRVMLCVFRESHCQGCVKWCQRANSVAGVAYARSNAPITSLVSSLWFSSGFAVSMGGGCKIYPVWWCQIRL